MTTGEARSDAMGNTTPLWTCVAGPENGVSDARAAENSTRPTDRDTLKWSIAPIVVIIILAFFVAMQSPITPWTKSDPGTDSGVFRYVAMVMSDGGMPYVDTFDHKGPLLYLINYAGMMIARLRGLWVVEFAFLVCAFLSMYFVSRLVCSRTGALVASAIAAAYLLSCFEGGNLVEEYAMPFIGASLLILLDFILNGRGGACRFALCGACLGAVLLLRPNMSAVWVVLCPVAGVLAFCKGGAGELARAFLPFLVGLLSVSVPMAAWLAVHGALGACVRDYVAFNLSYSEVGAGASPWSARASVLFTFGGNVYVAASAAALAYRAKVDRGVVWPSLLVVLLVSLVLASMSGHTYPHYTMTLVPIVCLAIASLAGIAEVANREWVRKAASVAALIYLGLACAVPALAPAASGAVLKVGASQDESYSDALEGAVAAVVANCSPQDRISVYGNWDSVYVLSGRLSASRYSYQSSITVVDPLISREYLEDLRDCMPTVVVIQAKRGDEFIASFLDEGDYELVWDQGLGAEGARAYRLRDAR